MSVAIAGSAIALAAAGLVVWHAAKPAADPQTGLTSVATSRLAPATAMAPPTPPSDVPELELNRSAWHLLTNVEYRSEAQLRADRTRALFEAETAASVSKRSNGEILETLAEALLQNGRQTEALEALDRVVALTRRSTPERLSQYMSGKSSHMLAQEFAALHRKGLAWTTKARTLSEAATRRELSVGDILTLTPVERSALRHSLFARRGQRAGARWADEAFQVEPWYKPSADFDPLSSLTDLDRRNLAAIRAVESGEAGAPTPPADDRNEGFVQLLCGGVRAPDGSTWLVGPDEVTSYATAVRWSVGLTACGGGWRLPTPSEVAAIYDPTRSAGSGYAEGGRRFPARIDRAFASIGTGAWAWTSSRDKSGRPLALNLYTGKFVSLTEAGRSIGTPSKPTTVRALAVRAAGAEPRPP